MSNYTDDGDLLAYEPNIQEYFPKNIPCAWSYHREAKGVIDEKIAACSTVPTLTPLDMRTLSTLCVLYAVLNLRSTREGDIFDLKAERYLRLFKEKCVALGLKEQSNE